MSSARPRASFSARAGWRDLPSSGGRCRAGGGGGVGRGGDPAPRPRGRGWRFPRCCPRRGAAALTAATAAVATLPAFATTRRGVRGPGFERVRRHARRRRVPVRALRGTGLLLEAPRIQSGVPARAGRHRYGAAHGYARAPLAVVGGIASAFAARSWPNPPPPSASARPNRPTRRRGTRRGPRAHPDRAATTIPPPAPRGGTDHPPPRLRAQSASGGGGDPASGEALARTSRARRCEEPGGATVDDEPRAARALTLGSGRAVAGGSEGDVRGDARGARLGRMVGRDARARARTKAREAQPVAAGERAAAAGDRESAEDGRARRRNSTRQAIEGGRARGARRGSANMPERPEALTLPDA